MKEYICLAADDGKSFWVQEDTDKPSFRIILTDEKEAHGLKLSLTLGTIQSPLKEMNNYNFVQNLNGTMYFNIKSTEPDDDGWDSSSCCQSGCPGCPWTEGNL